MLLSAFLVVLAAGAAAQAPTEGLDDEFERALQEQEDAFTDAVAAMDAEWEAWVRADSLAFASFEAEVRSYWGDYRGSTRKDWVEYSDDKTARSAVDFAAGEATVEVLVPVDADAATRQSRLREAVAHLARDRGKTMDYPVLNQLPRPLGSRPVLAGLLAARDGSVVTPENADAFAQEVVASASVAAVPTGPEAKVSRIKLSVTIPLVPNHLRVKAAEYLDTVHRYAGRYGLDSRMILAVIQTESDFNPKARSRVAFGLMQLVPSTGGRDAIEFLTGRAANPTVDELYDPTRNIELGCAYLSLVKDRYLAGIADLQSRLYCAICAYNTGAGNVSRAFTGGTRVKPAIARINTMSPDEVLATLKRDLPSTETKNYITNVLKRAALYEEWKN
ncbi:MAG: DUF3393 domain-containing protein [Krumholzibacteria bacterium]|nr:DUF3393 domain-containing protein [Candidatus Krumholzibacteria bacterium]